MDFFFGGRPCDLAATLSVATVEVPQFSVHRRSQWTFQFATETGTQLSAMVVMAAMKGFLGHFSRSSRLSGVERQFSEPSMAKSSLPSRVPAQFHSQHLSTWTFRLKDRVENNNNNNNTIWGGPVLTGEEPPPYSGELKHALTRADGPTQSQLSRPMSSGHHISMEHRLRRKQLNSDTNASTKNI